MLFGRWSEKFGCVAGGRPVLRGRVQIPREDTVVLCSDLDWACTIQWIEIMFGLHSPSIVTMSA